MSAITFRLPDAKYERLKQLAKSQNISVNKLLHNGELEILAYFEKQDIKGSYELRNFIAHNYEGVDLYIVEEVIKQRLPVIKQSIEKITKLIN